MNRKSLIAVAALHQIRTSTARDENIVVEALRRSVERKNFDEFSDIRGEFWLRNIALAVAVGKGCLEVSKVDIDAANEILLSRFVDRCAEDRKLSNNARQAFSRFCRSHDIETLDLRGGGNFSPRPGGSRSMDKEGQDVIDCSNAIQRRQLANGYIFRKIGKILALIDTLETTPGRKPDMSFFDTKQVLEKIFLKIQY